MMPVKAQVSIQPGQQINSLRPIKGPFDEAVGKARRELSGEIARPQLAAESGAPEAFKLAQCLNAEVALSKGTKQDVGGHFGGKQAEVDPASR